MGCSVALAVLLAPLAAIAAPQLHGTILAVQASKGIAVVNAGAIAGMPAMTMSYRIAPAVLVTLHPGAQIVANVDSATSPQTLSDVRVVASTSLVQSVNHRPNVTVLKIGDTVPQTRFVDQTGTPFTLAKYRGDDVVLAFIYSRCHDAQECPLTSAKFGELQTKLAGRTAHLIEVTLDPAYDTPAVLGRYGKIYGADPARWTFATGNPADILNFDAQFGLDPFADPTVGIIHGETLATIGTDGKIRDLIYSNAWQPSEIVASINEADHRASNPIARLDLWLSKSVVAICGNDLGGSDGLKDLLIMVAVVVVFGGILWKMWLALGMHIKER